MRSHLVLAAASALLALARPAAASSPSTFGEAPRSAALALADVADPEASSAPARNAAAAATPGVQLRLGWGYAGLALRIDDRDGGARDASGLDLGARYGRTLCAERRVELGVALAIHLPDTHLARVAFRPATEPQLPLWESPLQRTTVDAALALAWGDVALGAGAALSLDVGGQGTRFVLGQGSTGTYADGETDVTLPYHLAPLVGARATLGPVALGASFRGAMSIDLSLDSRADVALIDNPLNGTTTVHVRGASGYDPAAVELGARATHGPTSLFASLVYARWSDAPPPVADVAIDVALGTVPSQKRARFEQPRFRDTLTPRAGVELAWPERVTLRGGWSYVPSPVPRQTGLTTYADAPRHVVALGAGRPLGHAFGVDLRADLAAQAHVLVRRDEAKPDPSLPYARYSVSGQVLAASLALEGTWR